MDNQAVLNQVEFYFGDLNLRRDKWLLNEIKKNDHGYVPISALCTFNKMKALQATDVAAVAAALEPSTVVELSEDKTMVKRREPLPENDDSLERTVYAKGFPTTTTLAQLQEFWGKHGKVAMITMRRQLDKSFKGSVLVVFETQAEADSVLQKKDEFSFEENKLLIQTRSEWENEKGSTRVNHKVAKQEKKRKAEEDKEKERESAKQQFLEDIAQKEIPKNFVLKVTGYPESTTVQALKEHLNKLQKVAFVKFASDVSYARFESAFEKDLEKAQEEKFGDATLSLSLLSDEDAKSFWHEYWTTDFDKRQSRQNQPQSHRGGRGGRGGKRQRR